MKNPRILYIDLETSFNIMGVWRPGNKVSLSHHNILEERQIILASYAWDNEKPKTVRWEEDKKSVNKYIRYTDKPIIETLVPLIEEADLVIGQNHERFDLPWLRGRAMFHGIKLNTNIQTFDTLKKFRAHMGLNSYRLDYLGKFFSDNGKVDTGGFQLWIDCITGCPKAMNKMDKYCKGDITLLRKMYLAIKEFVPNTIHVGVHLGNERWSCPTCGSTKVGLNKKYTTRAGTLRYNYKCEHGHHYVLPQNIYNSHQKWKKENKGK